MPVHALGQLLILLLVSVLVIALARRIRLPVILGYLVVGILVGPHLFGVLPDSAQTRAIAEIGVVLLLFTLGLDFSFPRMVAMRREVFGLGSAQTVVVGGAAAVGVHAAGVGWPSAIVIGGAIAACSTAIVLQQLGDQDEINRTHGRLSVAVLLFQDLAFVPLLALATVLSQGAHGSGPALLLRLVLLGLGALAAVLVIGRWILRPLLHEIAHSRLRELFTLAALLIVLSCAWITERLGLSMALGAFLAGMMLAESEYSHQVEAAIRPFRELLLGLFFISVGMLLDLKLVFGHLPAVIGLLALLVTGKLLLSALTVRAFGTERFKALRTGLVLSGGGELGVALLTILAQGGELAGRRLVQLLLAALVLGMIMSPLIIRYNKRTARLLSGERGPPTVALERDSAAARRVGERQHVLLCGFGRVGRQLARVFGSLGFEYLALDLDPAVVRAARAAGEPVVWGDSADEGLLRNLGLAQARIVIVTFAAADVAIEVVRAVRRTRPEVPVLVRAPDDSRLAELSRAGATEVVPETFEASLSLVSQALALLHVPSMEVLHLVESQRRQRYEILRKLGQRESQIADPLSVAITRADAEEQMRSVVLPPGAWAVGRLLADARARGVEVAFAAVRRQGITGREPSDATELREGDVVVIYGNPAALEHAEAVLLAG